MSIACLQSEIDTGEKIATTFEKAESANSLPFAVYFHMGDYFCMGAYKFTQCGCCNQNGCL